MYHDRWFELFSERPSLVKIAYPGAEIESEDVVRYRQCCDQDSYRKTNCISRRDYKPREKHRGHGPRGIHRFRLVLRNGFQTTLIDLQSQNWDESHRVGDDWQIQFSNRGSSQEIVAEVNTDNSSDNSVGKIMREEPETEPGDKDE